mgnify:CR=1 FL=1
MEKIKMTTPIVEIDGDEMTRIMWQMVKEELILPHVELKSEYYDLGLLHRNDTDDQITVEAAEAALKYGVALKCATITANAQRMVEYPQLKKMYRSPNATIRSIMGGTIFREPILIDAVKPIVRNWKKPITIARHAYGDVYKAVELYTEEKGSGSLYFRAETGEEKEILAYQADGPAIWQLQHNSEESIRAFARSCFTYALSEKKDLWFSSKDTISTVYDGRFKAIFEEEFAPFREQFKENGITYFYTLIDDAVSRVMRSEGGFIWACKNYDGDVMSDMLSTCFGSLAMMTSVLVTPEGQYEYEAAHGTVTRHYYRYLKGEETSTNPVATIFVWANGLRKRGELDGNKALMEFGQRLKDATLDTLNAGIMTNDLILLCEDKDHFRSVTTAEFIHEVASRL